MTDTEDLTEEKKPAIRIKSAEDIFNALRSPDIGIRLSILNAVAKNIEKALSYGTYSGIELVDELIFQLKQNKDVSYRLALLSTLAVFKDRKAIEILKDEMKRTRDTQTIILIAERLSEEPEDLVRKYLSELLWNNDLPVHVRMAANILSRYKTSRADELVRIAIIADAPAHVPLFDEVTGEAWLSELGGFWAGRAMALIECQDERAFLHLRKKWKNMTDEIKIWLLDWGAREHQVYTVELLIDALGHGSERLILAALKVINSMGHAASLFSHMLSEFIKHKDSAVRSAALKAGAKVGYQDIKELLNSEKEPEVRIELMKRFSELPEAEAIDQLIQLLHDENWQIRAAATENLIRTGEPAIDKIKPLTKHSDKEIRLAAIKVLLALGRDEWLEETLCK